MGNFSWNKRQFLAHQKPFKKIHKKTRKNNFMENSFRKKKKPIKILESKKSVKFSQQIAKNFLINHTNLLQCNISANKFFPQIQSFVGKFYDRNDVKLDSFQILQIFFINFVLITFFVIGKVCLKFCQIWWLFQLFLDWQLENYFYGNFQEILDLLIFMIGEFS